jgi:3-phenylpropionate/cinnamic acid dioxygenase small subunit
VPTPDPAIAIPNLLHLYAERLDAGDFTAVARMFDKGCVVVEGEEIKGADAIEAMCRSYIRVHPDGTPRTRHIVSNLILDIEDAGRSAKARSLWTLLQATEALPLQVIGGGRYHDRFALADGEWHFTRREYAGVDFWGEASGHLLRSADKWEA